MAFRPHDAHFTTPRATRPVPVRMANAMGRPFAGRIDLSSDAIVARALAGLEPGAAGAIEFRSALDALCHSIAHETELHAIGRVAARDDTARLVRTQILVNQELARNPQILETPLPRPIYVIGWPRSGSTLLHTLLARDPAHRALLYYEGFDPSAPARGRDTRPQQLAKMLKLLEYLAPGYRAIHAMDPDSVEECVTVMYHTLCTVQMEFQYHCPSYLRFVEEQETLTPYTHYVKQLRMLQYIRPHGERWILKDPAHLLALDTIFELFPDAQLVWLHRDPARVMASIASLTAHTRALFSDAYGTLRVGKDVLEGIWPRAMRRALQLRDKLPADRIVDVRYADLMAEPETTLETIYSGLGLELAPSARQRMLGLLREKPQGAEGVHRYSCAQFGIDPESVRASFRDYRERFGIPDEARA